MIEENQRVELKKTFTAKDVETYFLLTGDSNPRYTEKTIGGRQIVPTGLLMGLISSILGTKLPGRGTNWLKQKLFFPEAAFTGEEITTIMEVTSVRPGKEACLSSRRVHDRERKDSLHGRVPCPCTGPGFPGTGIIFGITLRLDLGLIFLRSLSCEYRYHGNWNIYSRDIHDGC